MKEMKRWIKPERSLLVQEVPIRDFLKHVLPRKTYIDRHILLLFALMEVYLICQQHQHKQAEFLLWFSKKDQTDPAEEKHNTAI
jgi:hypothetical protein